MENKLTKFEDKERPKVRRTILKWVNEGKFTLEELARHNGDDNKTIFTSEGVILQARKMIREKTKTKSSGLREEIELIKAKRVEDRTKEEHIKLVKAFGGVRNYLLSMGPFMEDAFADLEKEMAEGSK